MLGSVRPAAVSPLALATRDPAASDRLGRIDLLCLLGLGVALQLNVLLSTFGLPFQRLSDLLPFGLIPYFALRREVQDAVFRHLARIGLVLACLAASIVLKTDQAAGDVYLTLVLLLYFVQALELTVLFRRDEAAIAALCWGILLGFAGSLAVLVAQAAGIDLTAAGLAVPTDLLDPEAVLFTQDKLGGLWTAGNETGHVYALAGAAALYLSARLGRPAIYVGYFVLLVASFPLTNNRAGLAVPAIVMAVVGWRVLSARVVLSALAGLAALGLVFGATGELLLPQGLQSAIEKRFVDNNDQVESNAGERLESTFATMKLVATHPFGIGVTAKQLAIKAETGLETSHNGLLSLALQSGVAIALLFGLGCWRNLRRPERFGSLAFDTTIFMLPSLLFEDLSVNQFVLFLMALTLAGWAMASEEA